MALESTPPVTKNNLVTNQFSARRRDQKRDDNRLYKSISNSLEDERQKAFSFEDSTE